MVIWSITFIFILYVAFVGSDRGQIFSVSLWLIPPCRSRAVEHGLLTLKIFCGVETWRLAGPLQDLEMLLKSLLCCLGGVFGIKLLKIPAAFHLRCLC